MSADPLGIHSGGLEADLNLYAYVSGTVLKNIDPVGLQEQEREPGSSSPGNTPPQAKIDAEKERYAGAVAGFHNAKVDTEAGYHTKKAAQDHNIRMRVANRLKDPEQKAERIAHLIDRYQREVGAIEEWRRSNQWSGPDTEAGRKGYAEGYGAKGAQLAEAFGQVLLFEAGEVAGYVSMTRGAVAVSRMVPKPAAPKPAAKPAVSPEPAPEPFVPDEYWQRPAPRQVTPGTRRIDHQRISGRTGRTESSRVIYDEHGRQSYRVDKTDHMRPADHSNPHLHETTYAPRGTQFHDDATGARETLQNLK